MLLWIIVVTWQFLLCGDRERDWTSLIAFFSFLSEKCFSFMLRMLFGYEIYLILQVIFNNSHLNWGINNHPLLTRIQLLPSSHESCQLCPYPLLFPSKGLWCTLWIYNYIVCIWAISCLSKIFSHLSGANTWILQKVW